MRIVSLSRIVSPSSSAHQEPSSFCRSSSQPRVRDGVGGLSGGRALVAVLLRLFQHRAVREIGGGRLLGRTIRPRRANVVAGTHSIFSGKSQFAILGTPQR